MSDQNMKLSGHIQNLVGQCPMTDCYFLLCWVLVILQLILLLTGNGLVSLLLRSLIFIVFHFVIHWLKVKVNSAYTPSGPLDRHLPPVSVA